VSVISGFAPREAVAAELRTTWAGQIRAWQKGAVAAVPPVRAALETRSGLIPVRPELVDE
jgi:hypothetical protein